MGSTETETESDSYDCLALRVASLPCGSRQSSQWLPLNPVSAITEEIAATTTLCYTSAVSSQHDATRICC